MNAIEGIIKRNVFWQKHKNSCTIQTKKDVGGEYPLWCYVKLKGMLNFHGLKCTTQIEWYELLYDT